MQELKPVFIPVTVVIPFFRAGKTILRALDSIKRQTHMPKEVIIIDDCSNDGSLEGIKETLKAYSDNWIRIYTLSKNSGPGAARNAGWEHASQPYVAFLDADDAWHSHKLGIQFAWMQQNPEVMVTGHPSLKYSKTHNSELLQPLCVKRVSLDNLLISNRFSCRSVMVRKELPLKFDKEKRFMEDHWWLLSLTAAGYQVYALSYPMAYTFKADYGESGLSKRLWQMEKGELDNYHRLKQGKVISRLLFYWLSVYSLAKYVRRLLIFMINKIYRFK